MKKNKRESGYRENMKKSRRNKTDRDSSDNKWRKKIESENYNMNNKNRKECIVNRKIESSLIPKMILSIRSQISTLIIMTRIIEILLVAKTKATSMTANYSLK